MAQYRDEVVRTVVEPANGDVIEERVIHEDGTVGRVVRTTVEPVAVAPVRTRIVRRWFRRPVAPTQVAITPIVVGDPAYVAAPRVSIDRSLNQFLRNTWFALGLLEAALAFRFGLALLGANPRNEFASAVYGLTYPFVAPFRTLFPSPITEGSVLETYTLVAMLMYLLLWWLVIKIISHLLNRNIAV